MRLFVAVRPPDDVLDAINALPRPAREGMRWTTRDQWHVTLRFFGEVEDPEPIAGALSSVALPATRAVLGARPAWLGRGVLQLPVSGLADLAAVVTDATATFGEPPPARRFRGHLTLARTRGREVLGDVALARERSWLVHEVELLRSHLGRGGARYEVVDRFRSGGV